MSVAKPERRFVDPPSHEEIQQHVDSSGFTGVKQWAFGVSVRIASDPGRWELFNMVQTGHMWLADYREEIQARVKAAQRGETADDIDFVDLVKTPHRTRNNVPNVNAEKLARINALHFGELEKDRNQKRDDKDYSNVAATKPAKVSDKHQEEQQPKLVLPQHPALSVSATNNIIPPPLNEEAKSYHQPSSSKGSAHDLPFAVSTSTVVPTTAAADRRFGPRPLPQVPGGARSRAPSNASIMMAAGLPNYTPILPSSSAPVNTRSNAMAPSDEVPSSSGSKEVAVSVATVSSIVAVPAKVADIPAPRATTPPSREEAEEEVLEEMDVELEMPLNDTTVAFERTSVFPSSLSRKPSFAALPELSPMRKSIRNTGSAELRGEDAPGSNKDGGRPSVYPVTPKAGANPKQTPAASKTQSAVKPSSSSGTRSSVRPSSGWLKGAATNNGLVAKDKTAANTAANAAISASSTGSVKRKSNDLLGKSGDEGDILQDERPSKAHKRDGSTYAMEKDITSSSKRSLDAAGDGSDTAERLLKLKGIAKIAVEDETRRMGTVESNSQTRISSQSDAPGSRPPSRTASEVKSKSRGDGSRMSVSDLVGTWEEKTSPTRPAPKEANTVHKKDSNASATFLPKIQPSSNIPKQQFPISKPVKPDQLLSHSTTPPGSPSRPSQERQRTISEKQSAAVSQPASQPISSQRPESQQAATSNPPAKAVYKHIPGPIFKPPPPKPTFQSKPKEEPRIFSRPPSYQLAQHSQPIAESQSTADDEETDSLFEKAIKKGAKGKVDVEVFSQETAATEFTWGDPGLTAGWMGKGNDTIGEHVPKQKMPGAFRDDEEETEWGTAEDGGTGDHLVQPKAENNDDEMDAGDFDDQDQEPQESEIDEIMDDDDEVVVEDADEPEPVIVKVAPAPTPAPSRGIFAQVGSLASKAASTLGSLRAAAVAAEKEKAEREKKEAGLAARREAALQKKAEEDAKRKAEVEKKKKLEEERRKKEKADAAALNRSKLNKSTTIPTVKKQPELKRPPSKLGLNSSTQGKPKVAPTPTIAFKRAPTPTGAPTIKLVSANASASASTTSLIPVPERIDKSEKPASILGPSTSKPGVKITWDETAAKTTITNTAKVHSLHPAMKVQQQATTSTSTRVEAQVVRKSEGGIDENEELPDIRSEYSDSEDEDRVRSFLPPGWAQSPDLRQALEDMRTVNPDMIFGAMPQLRMDEIFPGRRKSKFRARTSSANWAGTDGVTAEEEIEYARRMGFDE